MTLVWMFPSQARISLYIGSISMVHFEFHNYETKARKLPVVTVGYVCTGAYVLYYVIILQVNKYVYNI